MDTDKLWRMRCASNELEEAASQLCCAIDRLRDAIERKTADNLIATLEKYEAELRTLITQINGSD